MDPETVVATPGSLANLDAARPLQARLRRLLAPDRSASEQFVDFQDSAGRRLVERGVWMFVVLGLALRIIRYAQNLPLWSDECFLVVNFIHRGFLDLVNPLDNGQICPLLFLWIERAAVMLLGFSESSLRLFPLLCGLASMILFERLARLALRGVPLLLAVGIFAVSVHPIRHAAEAKPYASDLLVSLMLTAAAAAWLRTRERSGWLWLLLVMLPPCLALSNPAVFVAGGILIGLAWPVWRTGRWADRSALACSAVMLCGLFLVFHVGFGGIQSTGAMEGLRRYWTSGFPPIREPLKLPGWFLAACTGSMLAYPGGGARGASTATFVAFLVGGAFLARRGQGALVTCLAAPFGLTLFASILQRYPFGTEARLMQFAAPAVCLLGGTGAAVLLGCIRSRKRRGRAMILMLAALVGCGIVPQIVSSTVPYRMVHDQESREFARRFWPEMARDAEAACAHLDFHIDRPGVWQGRKAWYLCNQAIYSPQRQESGGPRFDRVSADRPLRCVVFDEDPNDPDVLTWLARMQSDYRLQSMKTIKVPVTLGIDDRKLTENWLVYEFTPVRDQTEHQDDDLLETTQ